MKIEVGKRYWRRDGGISPVVQANVADKVYRFIAGVETYTSQGKFYHFDDEHELDLIAEYTGPELVPPGEKVKRTIVFRESFQRFGTIWAIFWESEGFEKDSRRVAPDEIVYTGNERTVEV